MIKKRVFSVIIDSLIFLGFTMHSVAFLLLKYREYINYTWTPVVVVLTLSMGYYYWSYRRGGGFGMTIMALTVVDDAKNKIGFVRYFTRSIHFVVLWVLLSIDFSMFLVNSKPADITYDNWKNPEDYGLRVFYTIVLLAIFLDKICILWGYYQKSILESLLRLNVVSYKP